MKEIKIIYIPSYIRNWFSHSTSIIETIENSYLHSIHFSINLSTWEGEIKSTVINQLKAGFLSARPREIGSHIILNCRINLSGRWINEALMRYITKWECLYIECGRPRLAKRRSHTLPIYNVYISMKSPSLFPLSKRNISNLTFCRSLNTVSIRFRIWFVNSNVWR